MVPRRLDLPWTGHELLLYDIALLASDLGDSPAEAILALRRPGILLGLWLGRRRRAHRLYNVVDRTLGPFSWLFLRVLGTLNRLPGLRFELLLLRPGAFNEVMRGRRLRALFGCFLHGSHVPRMLGKLRFIAGLTHSPDFLDFAIS